MPACAWRSAGASLTPAAHRDDVTVIPERLDPMEARRRCRPRRSAVRRFRAARRKAARDGRATGVRAVMITGDTAATAAVVARAVGLGAHGGEPAIAPARGYRRLRAGAARRESATGPPSCPASSMRSPRRASASIAVVSTGTPAIAATAAGAPFSTRSLRPAPAAAFRAGDPARRVERRESHDARAPERRRTTLGARAPARRVANRRIDGVRRALGARERRASQHVVLARVRRGRALRIAPYRSVSRHDGLRIGEPPLRSGSRRARRGA